MILNAGLAQIASFEVAHFAHDVPSPPKSFASMSHRSTIALRRK